MFVWCGGGRVISVVCCEGMHRCLCGRFWRVYQGRCANYIHAVLVCLPGVLMSVQRWVAWLGCATY